MGKILQWWRDESPHDRSWMKFCLTLIALIIFGAAFGISTGLWAVKISSKTNPITDESFEAHCPAPCYAQINDVPVKIRTNKVEKILNGTKASLTVWLACHVCNRTNAFASEIMTQTPWATHVLKPRLPRREIQPPVPPLPTNIFTMPPGYHLELMKDK